MLGTPPAAGLTPACAGTSTKTSTSCQTARAHPRVRGDVAPLEITQLAGRGSPPRARGRQLVGAGALRDHGLTPACAGTSRTAPPAANFGRAHPRVRGDVDFCDGCGFGDEGSPPRARGRLGRDRVADRAAGLTPACAGTSTSPDPRMVGKRGSPPRARGRQVGANPPFDGFGLTPACAGTSHLCRAGPVLPGAHPRVRGDVTAMACSVKIGRGSPPRARGRPRREDRDDARRGLTPACAGTSARLAPTGSASRAHPRVRGDVNRVAGRGIGDAGSPPRARGRLWLPADHLAPWGLTPACAGTSRFGRPGRRGCWAHPRVRGDVSSSRTALSRWSRAHPRVRGDVVLGCGFALLVVGSPPRARGRPQACTWVAGWPWAHPRVRGDVPDERGTHQQAPGSPPRARGRPRWPVSPRVWWRAHPRVRGDVHCWRP